jgi:hypothetical protein
VDFTMVGGSAPTASLSGAPLRLLFSSFNRSLFWFYSRPEITDVKQLKDKKSACRALARGQPHRRPNRVPRPLAWIGSYAANRRAERAISHRTLGGHRAPSRLAFNQETSTMPHRRDAGSVLRRERKARSSPRSLQPSYYGVSSDTCSG